MGEKVECLLLYDVVERKGEVTRGLFALTPQALHVCAARAMAGRMT